MFWKSAFSKDTESPPCVSRQEISKESQMVNELTFIPSMEKSGDRPSFTAGKPRQQ